jgi:3-methyladenine DNA glycosylase AlkC
LSVQRVISGGQTGVDRAALDVALELGIPCGGWCPRGRRAEDGPISKRYPLRETASRQYAQRTRWNVRDADGTLIITAGKLTGGTALTRKVAERLGRPCYVVDLSVSRAVVPVSRWIRRNSVDVLNIAGPRESTAPGIQQRARRYLRRLLSRVTPADDSAKSQKRTRGNREPRRRVGARSRSEIPRDVLQQLNRGEIETATLAEGLALDFRKLLSHVAPHVKCPPELNSDGKVGITGKMSAVGLALHAGDGLDELLRYRTHTSDTVRGWAAYVISAAPDLSLSRRLRLVQPLADDQHFGVREWAWLALRPHIAADVPAALRSLSKWATRPSENLRRFAIEITRPRGVWCGHLQELKERPEPALELLEMVRADPSKYVQDSVANWLNDSSKSRPDWVEAVTTRWLKESATDNTRRIVRRALRSLRKA